MTIQDAISVSKKSGNWNVVPHCPTSVDVDFKAAGKWDQIQFDLYGDNLEEELIDLWTTMYAEYGADLDSVSDVNAYGYICE